jgi:vancomycin resistance protein YoaR
VTNIKRASALLDGTVIGSGETFLMNETLMRRTVRRGFVPAPQISGGRVVDAVGGGISQVATTLYNAAFFAGLDLIAHTPHSFYISRYPKGREATISWGGPELIFRNDWTSPVQMRLAASDTGVTVRFLSTREGRRVETTTGQPYRYEQPRTIEIVNYRLRPGDRRLAQAAGPAGFTINYTRRVYRDETLRRNERFRVRYQPEHAIVEVGPERGGP